MSRQEGVSALQLSRMKERLAQVEEMIRNSQMEFTDAITVRNISGRNLQLTLNITDRHHHSASDEINYDSRINVPNNSTVNHQFTRHNKEYFSHDYKYPIYSHNPSQHKQSPSTKNCQFHQSPDNRNTHWSTVQRNQQKFQSSGSRKKIQETIDSKKEKDHMIMILDEDTSDVEEEHKVHPFTSSEFKNNVSMHKDPNNQTFGNVNMSISNNIINASTHSKQPQSIQKSPQVYSYLHQQVRQDHPEINTSFKKHNDLNNSVLKTPQKSQSKQSPIISNKKPRNNLNENSIHKSQNKAVPISAHEVTTHKKKVQTSKDNKSISKSNTLKHQPKNKIKAQQLYMERKQINPINKSIIQHSKHSNYVESRINRFVTAVKDRKESSLSKRSLSPKVQAITERLYVKQKSPCGHYRHYSQSQERQRFMFLVEQNPMVSKYMGSQERQELFQHLRNDPDSVSLWPMKIVNYTNAKLKHSCSVNLASLSM